MQDRSINVSGNFNGTLNNGDTTYMSLSSNPDSHEKVAEDLRLFLENKTDEFHLQNSSDLVFSKIESSGQNSTLLKRTRKTLQAIGVEAFRELVDHPLFNLFMAGLSAWMESSSSASTRSMCVESKNISSLS